MGRKPDCIESASALNNILGHVTSLLQRLENHFAPLAIDGDLDVRETWFISIEITHVSNSMIS